MTEQKQSLTTKYEAKIIPDKSIAKTDPMNNDSNVHDIDEIGQKSGVELADNEELAIRKKLELRDKER